MPRPIQIFLMLYGFNPAMIFLVRLYGRDLRAMVN